MNSKLELKDFRAQFLQDMFVVTVLNNKEHGTYLEIGANHPSHYNNTFVLEKRLNWLGVSLEISSKHNAIWLNQRKNKCLIADALTADYGALIDEYNLGNIIDYLSVDIEPPQNTFDALKRIPHDKVKFRVLTFEHDSYSGEEGLRIRSESREYLSNLGYHMVVNDIGINGSSVEDWYVYPELVDMNRVDMLQCNNETMINYNEYFLPKPRP